MSRSLFKTLSLHWKITLFVLFFFPVLLKLGFWQLDRADEKQALVSAYHKQQTLAAIPLKMLPITENRRYQKVIVTGVYDTEHYWLLDNRSRQGRVGYEVIMPFMMDDEGILLINRGWVPSTSRRSQLPKISTPTTKVTLEGYLAIPPANAIIKHSENDWIKPWPKRILQLDLQVAARDLNTAVYSHAVSSNTVSSNTVSSNTASSNTASSNTVYPHTIYPQLLNIDHGQAGAFMTDWTIINMSPQKHQAYAIQWFTLSIVLLLLYAWYLLRAYTSGVIKKQAL